MIVEHPKIFLPHTAIMLRSAFIAIDLLNSYCREGLSIVESGGRKSRRVEW